MAVSVGWYIALFEVLKLVTFMAVVVLNESL